jgi:hypothetical protein
VQLCRLFSRLVERVPPETIFENRFVLVQILITTVGDYRFQILEHRSSAAEPLMSDIAQTFRVRTASVMGRCSNEDFQDSAQSN